MASPPAPTGGPALGDRDERRFWLGVTAVVVVALMVGTAYVVRVLHGIEPGLDAVWYLLQAGAIREGHGFVVPASLFTDSGVPTGGFPPAYPAVLAAWQVVAGDGLTTSRLLGVVLSAGTVVTTALLGRRVLGPGRVGTAGGLAAAAIVAIDPHLVATAGSGMSEALSVPLVTLATLLVVRARDRGPTAGQCLLIGALCGAAALTRQDLLVAAPLFALALVVGRPELRIGRRVLLGALVLVATAVLVVPWAVRNQRTLGSFTVATISGPSAVAGANCDQTYAGSSLGSWEFSCVVAAQRLELPEGEQGRILHHAGTSYARAHLDQVPVVVAARQARVWGFWNRDDQVRREVEESRHPRWQRVAWGFNPILVLVGAAGLVVLARRDLRRALPLFVPPLLVMMGAAASYGNPRFSAIAHPVLAIGAVALMARLLTYLIGRRTRSVSGDNAEDASVPTVTSPGRS